MTLHKEIHKLLTNLAYEKGFKRATYAQNLINQSLENNRKQYIPKRYHVYHNQSRKQRDKLGIETVMFNLRLDQDIYEKLLKNCRSGHLRGISIAQALRIVLTYELINEAKHSRNKETRNV